MSFNHFMHTCNFVYFSFNFMLFFYFIIFFITSCFIVFLNHFTNILFNHFSSSFLHTIPPTCLLTASCTLVIWFISPLISGYFSTTLYSSKIIALGLTPLCFLSNLLFSLTFSLPSHQSTNCPIVTYSFILNVYGMSLFLVLKSPLQTVATINSFTLILFFLLKYDFTVI